MLIFYKDTKDTLKQNFGYRGIQLTDEMIEPYLVKLKSDINSELNRLQNGSPTLIWATIPLLKNERIRLWV